MGGGTRPVAATRTENMTDDPIQTNDDAIPQEPLDELEVLRAEIEQLKAASLIERADLENQRRRLGRELPKTRERREGEQSRGERQGYIFCEPGDRL